MTVFISGGAKNGKSTLAQKMAVKLAGGGKRYYVATMIPTGEEDEERIRRHIADRAGMGFETVECFEHPMSCLEKADRDGTFLIDSATALLQNALFPADRNYEMDPDNARRCGEELVELVKTVRSAVVVSDYIFSDAERYSESTELYRKSLAELDRRLARLCDTVIEVSGSRAVIHKGEMVL